MIINVYYQDVHPPLVIPELPGKQDTLIWLAGLCDTVYRRAPFFIVFQSEYQYKIFCHESASGGTNNHE